MPLRYELVIKGYGIEEFDTYEQLEERRKLWTRANYYTSVNVIYIDPTTFTITKSTM